MNKNSTQREIRNFVSKISDFFKMSKLLPANLQVAANFVLAQCNKLFQLPPVSNPKTHGSFSFENYHNKFIIRNGSVLKAANYYAVSISSNKAYLPAYFYFLNDRQAQSNVKPALWEQL